MHGGVLYDDLAGEILRSSIGGGAPPKHYKVIPGLGAAGITTFSASLDATGYAQ